MTEENNEPPKRWWEKNWKKIIIAVLLLLLSIRGYQLWNTEEVVAVTSEEVAVASDEVIMTRSAEKEEESPKGNSAANNTEKQVIIIRNNCDEVLFYGRKVPQKGMLMVYQGQYEGKHVFSSGPMKIPGYNKKDKIENCLEVKASRDDSFYESRGFQSRSFEYLLRGNEEFHENSEHGACNGLKFMSQ